MKIKNIINILELNLTNYCSLQCEGCPSLPNLNTKKKNFLFIDSLEILKNLEVERVVLCGDDGEPLEHPDILNILKKLQQFFPDAQIHVSTNGELIPTIFQNESSTSFANVLFEVAIDGSTQAIHEITRKQGNLENVKKAIQFLLEGHYNVQLITSRHASNEDDLLTLGEKIQSWFGIENFYRDTSIVNSRIKPPQKISKKADVSIIYAPKSEKKIQYTPYHQYLYISVLGECYPCVSFTKHKTELSPPRIQDYATGSKFLEDFKAFQKEFCDLYQIEGDLRQCQVNCGIFNCNYQYDSFGDIKALYD